MNLPKKINKVILYLTLSDIFTWGLLAITNALAGIYLAQKIDEDPAEVVGIGLAFFYIARGGFQIPVGLFTDNRKKDKDDLFFLGLGNLLIGLPFLFYPLITSQYTFFGLQIILGTGCAFNLVTWRKMFAKNLDQDKEGQQYAVYDAIMSVCISIFGAIAGIVASIEEKYFDLVMVVIGLMMITSIIWVAGIITVKNRKSMN